MNEADIKPGDVVGLKSGSPTMTVVKLIPDAKDGPSAKCLWFEGEGLPHEREFALVTLTLLEDVDGDDDDDLDEDEDLDDELDED